MGKVQMGIAAVLSLIIRSIETGKPDSALAIAKDALKQLEAQAGAGDSQCRKP